MSIRREARHRFRFDGGAAWLDLVATVDGALGPDPVERLGSPGRLGEWLDLVGLAPDSAPGAADLAAARELRESLRRLALAIVDRQEPDAGDLAVLNDSLAAAGTQRVQLSAGRLGQAPPPTAREALGRVALQAAVDLCGQYASALRACADRDCRLVFLDWTHRRRWCAPDRCGSRARVRAHRRRRRESGGA